MEFSPPPGPGQVRTPAPQQRHPAARAKMGWAIRPQRRRDDPAACRADRPARREALMNRCTPHRLPVVAALFLLGLFAPPAARADAVSDFEAMRENQRKNTTAALSTMPLVDARHIDDVMRLRLEAGHFVIRTPLPTTKAPGYA